jgi:hypothetical protein
LNKSWRRQKQKRSQGDEIFKSYCSDDWWLLPLVMTVASGSAATVTFDWALTSNATPMNGGFPLLGSGTISATTSATGIDPVTAITGTVGGSPITGLTTFQNASNLLYLSGFALLDLNGLSFENAAGQNINIFSFFSQGTPPTGNAYGERVLNANGSTAFGVGTFALVPGPIVGAGVPGLILASGGLLAWWRRRRQKSPELPA